MPSNVEVNQDVLQELQEFTDRGGLAPKTLKSKEKAEEYFGRFLIQNNAPSIDELLQQPDQLEDLLRLYFETYRVKNSELPMKNTVQVQLSHLKMLFLTKSSGKIDITQAYNLPKFANFWKSYLMKLKDEGKCDTKSHQEISKTSLVAIYELLSALSNLMVMDQSHPEFLSQMEKIPLVYQTSYHKLVQMGAVFIILTQVYIFPSCAPKICLRLQAFVFVYSLLDVLAKASII